MRSKISAQRALASVHDAVMAGMAMYLSLMLRYGSANLPSSERVWFWVVSFVAICAVVFRIFGLGRGMWRFASITDLRAIGASASVSVVAFVLVMFAIDRLDDFPRTVPVILWFVLPVLIGTPRLLYRLLKDGRLRNRGLKEAPANVIIVGTASEADAVIRTYSMESTGRFRVHGIVDYKPNKRGRFVRGIPVIGQLSDIEAIVRRLGRNGVTLDAIVLAAVGHERPHLTSLFEALPRLQVPLRRVTTSSLTGAEPDLENVGLEDLLGRPPVRLEVDGIRNLVAGRVVVVTGAGGSIGSEIVRQVASYGPARVVLIESSEFALYRVNEMLAAYPAIARRSVIANVRDKERMREVIGSERPFVVFHAAALKHVPLVEENVCEGALTNVVGSANVADAAVAADVDVVVMISTDKAIRPTSIMGASKRAAEAYCQALDVSGVRTRFITVRFGNVLGSTGSVVPLFKRQIKAGGPITITHPEMRRYFMSIREATELVLQAAVAGLTRPEQRGRIFVLDMGEPVKIVDLARTMIVLAGMRPDEDVKITFTGLRKGEKLFEELFDKDEPTMPSGVDGVFLASARMIELERMKAMIEAISEAARAGNVQKVRENLAVVAPGLPIGGENAAPSAPVRPATGQIVSLR